MGEPYNNRRRVWLGALCLALASAVILGITFGAVDVSFGNLSPAIRAIIWEIRLPRVLLAGFVGAALTLAGVVFQALFSNPLADPYVIGASAGASLGATLAIVFSLQMSWWGFGAVPLLAFGGALVTVTAVYNLARIGGRVSSLTLLLAGLGVSASLSAVVSLIIYFAGQQLTQVVFWLMGGFSGATWKSVELVASYFAVGAFVIFVHALELDALLFGEEEAQTLGVDVRRVRFLLVSAASLLTAAAVAVSGLIGFVGLVVPHLVRMLVGPGHRILLPAAGLTGAAMLILADLTARTVIAPTELPVGLITALCGGPFFVYLLRQKKPQGARW